MELQTLLERVEPSRLKQLGTLFSLGDGLSKSELVDWVSQELPFCQVEEDGACVGIDGAFYIAVDWVNDMMTLEFLRETPWIRVESNGRKRRFVITEEASDLSLKDARLLLALLAVATYNDGDLPIPDDLLSPRFSNVLRLEEVGDPAPPSQRPDSAAEVRRPSIPPGFSQTFDSMRPRRQSVRPGSLPSNSGAEGAADDEDDEQAEVIAVEPALIEYVLTLSRHSLLSAAFALAERGARTHAVCIGQSGRAILNRDTIAASQRLYEDHRDSMPPPANHEALTAYRKRLTSNLTYFGIPTADASALVAIALETDTFPDFYSDQYPPPVKLLKKELAEAPQELTQSILNLMYECFFCEQLDSINALALEVLAT